MGALEQRFAAYLVQMTAVTPADTALARINAPYAHTYLLEDSYLATLAADLGSGDFGNLPDTQDQQRLAIIEWRVQLQLAAARAGYLLPADIQQAWPRRDRPQPGRQLTRVQGLRFHDRRWFPQDLRFSGADRVPAQEKARGPCGRRARYAEGTGTSNNVQGLH